jgi:hypothetical protein
MISSNPLKFLNGIPIITLITSISSILITIIRFSSQTICYLNSFYRHFKASTISWTLNDINLKLSERRIMEYFSFFREIMSSYLKTRLPLITYSGTWEIDETYIGAPKRGYIGRIPKRHHTVFGTFF